jgi:hypothetical protein
MNSRLHSLRERVGAIQPSRTNLLVGLLMLVLGIVVFFAVLLRNPFAVDWHYTYRPATLAILRGENPYSGEVLFFAPPWVVIPLIPFAVLPEDIGRSLFAVLSIGMFALIAYRLGAKPLGLLAFLLSAPVANGIQTGNVEWLVLLGLLLPPQIGLILLAIKPQSTLGVLLFYLVEAWRKGQLREVIAQFWPLAAVSLLSLLIYGLWPLRAREYGGYAGEFNISLWPHSIPIGLTLLAIALRDRRRDAALIGSPFLSPYLVLVGWSGALAGLAPRTLEIVVASIGTWIFWTLYYLAK